MFGIGFTELILIVVVALIVIGPDKLPEVARVAGKAFMEFRKAVDGLKDQVTDLEGEARAGAAEGLAREKDETGGVEGGAAPGRHGPENGPGEGGAGPGRAG